MKKSEGLFETIKRYFSNNNEDISDDASETKSSQSEIRILISQLKDLQVNSKITEYNLKSLEKENNTTKWVLGLLITIIAFEIPILCNMHSRSIDKSLDAYNKEIIPKIESIEKRLDDQKEYNQMQIERDVAIEIKNQQTHK